MTASEPGEECAPQTRPNEKKTEAIDRLRSQVGGPGDGLPRTASCRRGSSAGAARGRPLGPLRAAKTVKRPHRLLRYDL